MQTVQWHTQYLQCNFGFFFLKAIHRSCTFQNWKLTIISKCVNSNNVKFGNFKHYINASTCIFQSPSSTHYPVPNHFYLFTSTHSPSNAHTDNTWIKYCDRKLLIYTKEVPETQELDVYPTLSAYFSISLFFHQLWITLWV